jgi:hypothetical protein
VGLGVRHVAEVRNESTEETHVELVSAADLPRLVKEGAVNHALVIAAFHLLEIARAEGIGV